MFTLYFFTLLSCLILSHWTHSHEEQSNAWEETVSARLGPFYLESSDVSMLDHSDVYKGKANGMSTLIRSSAYLYLFAFRRVLCASTCSGAARHRVI